MAITKRMTPDEILARYPDQRGDDVDHGEADTRRDIDAQLRGAGWEVDTAELTHGKGARPQEGKNLAIAEWPTRNGPADYVLFVGLEPVAVVEAKRRGKDIAGSIEQAKRYSRGYSLEADQRDPGGPWGEYRIPFLFAANGRRFLRRPQTRGGIWFLDGRRPQNLSRLLEGWYTPEGLVALLKQDLDKAHARLEPEPAGRLGLRDSQLAAIYAVEAAIKKGQRGCLVVMAAGTGKTRTGIVLLARLLEARRFRRVLLLVDRSALGEQAANAYKDVRLDGFRTFADIFGMKELGEIKPDSDTRLQIATIQGMIRRVLFPKAGEEVPPIDQYDCIVVDECHRGYLLDREVGDAELQLGDERDYLSKYRRVLDHFDAVKIGLTATPALHTTEIFGPPVFQYSYREAVLDGTLVDHEPPIRIVTRLAEDGMHWASGAEMELYDTRAQTLDTVVLPDEVDLDIDSYNRRVVTEHFNRVVCAALAEHLDPSLPGKTIIFCATDDHADLVVRLLKEALAARYGGIEDDAVLKITGAADRPLQLIRRFKNERNPGIAVTVDLLTTGIDVPAICNVVFLRRVRSRILYEQMLGRATRRCDEIGKEVFRIFDAVDLYPALEPVSDMKRVMVGPRVAAARLARAHGPVVALLDRSTGGGSHLIISHHEDELRRIERRHGKGERPADYLEGFAGFVEANLDTIPVLRVVIQRPRELTRRDLKELGIVLSRFGYSEVALQVAWRETIHQDIAAGLIGFIRRAALGEALMPYAERIDRAVKGILAARPWTDRQRMWLERIGRQLRVETIVDRESLDLGQFKTQGGGFKRIDKEFDGKLEAVLGDLHEALWRPAG